MAYRADRTNPHAMDNTGYTANPSSSPRRSLPRNALVRGPGSSTAVGKPLDSGLRRNDGTPSPRRRPGSRTAVEKPLDSGLRRNDESCGLRRNEAADGRPGFMFLIDTAEWEAWRSQNVISKGREGCRNAERSPADFMFQLTKAEKQEVVTNRDHLVKLKFSPTEPYAFTEHGALMLGNVLRTEREVDVSLHIVRTEQVTEQVTEQANAMDSPNRHAEKVSLPRTAETWAVTAALDSGLRRNDEEGSSPRRPSSSPRRRPGSRTAVENPWIPACAGMTKRTACAGMTRPVINPQPRPPMIFAFPDRLPECPRP